MNVKKGDMYYAYSKNPEIKANGEYGGVVTTIMECLLKNNIVDGVVVVEEGADLYDAVPCFIENPQDVIKSAGSIHCGTMNLAKFISKYLDGCRDMKIAVTCKPCESRTIVELIKKGKIISDNIIMIGINCGGTLPPVRTMQMIEDIYEIDPKRVVKEEISEGKLIIWTVNGDSRSFSIKKLEDGGKGRRKNCQRCELKIPSNTDIALGNWGVVGSWEGNATFVEVFSCKGARILEKVIKDDLIEIKSPSEEGIAIRDRINNSMLELGEKSKEKLIGDLTGDIIEAFHEYEDEFSRCMKCYGCREACPLCYCDDCSLESEGPEWVPGGYTPASPFFHLTRMVHMVDSCTNCGQCSEVCPCEIDVAGLWSTVNNKVREEYGYYSGFKISNMIPFTQYHFKK